MTCDDTRELAAHGCTPAVYYTRAWRAAYTTRVAQMVVSMASGGGARPLCDPAEKGATALSAARNLGAQRAGRCVDAGSATQGARVGLSALRSGVGESVAATGCYG
jgi:hypothetical protein